MNITVRDLMPMVALGLGLAAGIAAWLTVRGYQA